MEPDKKVHKKTALVRISGDASLERGIIAYLQTIGVEPKQTLDTGKSDLEKMLLEKEVIDIVITNDPDYVATNVRLDSSIPFVYIGKAKDEEHPKNVEYAVDFFQAADTIRKSLQTRDEARVAIAREMGEKDIALYKAYVLRGNLIKLEGKLTSSESTILEKDSLDVGRQLANMLSKGTGKLAVKTGKGAHHEGSGWQLVDTFVKIVHGIPEVPGGKAWTAKENAVQRYNDGCFFEGKKNEFPIAHTYRPIHFENFSLMMYDFAEGLTLFEVFRHLYRAHATAAGQTKTKQRKLQMKTYEAITTGLAERQLRYLAFWVTHAPSLLSRHQQSGEEVRTYYTYSLQNAFEKALTQVKPNTFLDDERSLWNDAVGDVMAALRYDNEFIGRYRDLSSRNGVIARRIRTVDDILREFVDNPKIEKGRVILTKGTKFKDVIAVVETTTDSRAINLDTNVRSMHVLEDFYHLIVEPELWEISGSSEDSLFSKYLEKIADDRFDPASVTVTERAAMGFYRSTRKLGNLVDFGANADSELRRGFLKRDSYVHRIKQFSRDINHYIDMAQLFLDRVIGEKLKESTDFSETTRLVASLESRFVTSSEYRAELGRVTDVPSRTACQAALVKAYLERLKSAFSVLHYNGSGRHA